MTVGQSLFFYLHFTVFPFLPRFFYFKKDFFCDEQWSMVLFCTFFFFLFSPPQKREKVFIVQTKNFIWWYSMGSELDIVCPNVSAKTNGWKIIMELLCKSFFFFSLKWPIFPQKNRHSGLICKTELSLQIELGSSSAVSFGTSLPRRCCSS